MKSGQTHYDAQQNQHPTWTLLYFNSKISYSLSATISPAQPLERSLNATCLDFSLSFIRYPFNLLISLVTDKECSSSVTQVVFALRFSWVATSSAVSYSFFRSASTSLCNVSSFALAKGATLWKISSSSMRDSITVVAVVSSTTYILATSVVS